MSKYDCNKTLDYAHEFKRMCFGKSCQRDNCPFLGKSCSPDSITDEHIQILQKWSDEHPEPPKIQTRRVAGYAHSLDNLIHQMTFEELMELEVEE